MKYKPGDFVIFSKVKDDPYNTYCVIHIDSMENMYFIKQRIVHDSVRASIDIHNLKESSLPLDMPFQTYSYLNGFWVRESEIMLDISMMRDIKLNMILDV